MLGKYATARFGVIMGIVVSLCLVVALVCVFCLPRGIEPNATLDQGDSGIIDSVDSFVEPSTAATNVAATNGSYTWEQKTESGKTFYELVATPSAGYRLAYWKKGETKISGDQTIRVSTNSGYTPIFSNDITYITSLTSISLTAPATKIYVLTQDINAGTFSPLGAGTRTTFNGIIDGNGHKIFNLQATNSSGSYFGGIVCRLGGVIKNLTIYSGVINGTTGAANVGAFAGTIEGGLISRCINRAEVKGDMTANTPNVGGIVGAAVGTTAYTSSIYCCENYGSVTGNKVGAILYHNPTVSGKPVCYLIKNVYQGSMQTN